MEQDLTQIRQLDTRKVFRLRLNWKQRAYYSHMAK